ncbi:MAG: AsmA family protein [FCB group bacterium]|nr:AsmA family protein [FCB group bacterium]
MAEKKSETTAKKKGLGCLPRLLILIIIIALCGWLAVTFFFPAERIKDEIVNKASEALGRHVELDGVSLSFYPSISLRLSGLRVFNPEGFPGDELVSVSSLNCGLKLMPLLSRRFVFDEITVDHPVLHLRKMADGRTNYSFEIDTGEEGLETPLGKKEKLSSEEAALSAFAFDWAEIKGADIIYIDDSADIRVNLNNLQLETRLHLDADGQNGRSLGTLKIPSISSNLLPENLPLDLELAYNADIDFQYADLTLSNTTLKINGIPFEVEATVRNFLDPQSIFTKLKATDVSIEPLLAYIPAGTGFDPTEIRLSGQIDGAVEARIEMGGGRTPYLSGALKFNDLSIGYLDLKNRLYFKTLDIAFNPDTVSFVSAGGKLSDEDFYLAGTAKNWDDLAFAVTTKGSYDLAGILPFMEPEYGHQLSGRAHFDLELDGQKSNWIDMDIQGQAGVEKVFYTNDSLTSPLNRLDMDINFQPNKVIIESLYAEYPGVKMTLTGTMKNGFAHLLQPRGGHKKPYLDFQLKAPLIDYDILVPEEEVIQTGVDNHGGQTTELPAPIFLPDIEAGGRVVVDKLVFRGIEITDIQSEVGYKDGIISYKKAQGRIYSGRMQSDGSVDINDMYQPYVSCTFAGQDIEADDFLTQMIDAGGHLFGKFDVDGTLAGRGSEPEDFINSLDANGHLSMKEGRLVNFDLISRLADQFKFKTFEEESLRDLATAITVRDGKVLLEGTKLFSKMGDWNIGGTVAFIDRTLDLRVGLYLSPEFSKKLDLFGGLLEDDQGRVKVNFNLTGDYDNPTVSNLSTDNSAAQKKVEDAVKEGAKKLLDGLFKK